MPVNDLPHSLLIVIFLLFGLCAGSFLNVVISRVPRGDGIIPPWRSSCPNCECGMPWYRSLPVISWCLQRVRCAGCNEGIPSRSPVVEVVTGLLFAAAVWRYEAIAPSVLLAFLLSLLVVIIWIDAELMIIPARLTNLGIVVGIAGSVFVHGVLDLTLDPIEGWRHRLLMSVVGAAAGFASLKVVIWIGKLAFGKVHTEYPEGAAWSLREPVDEMDQLSFVIDGEASGWGDIFYRASDRLLMPASSLVIDGEPVGEGDVEIREKTISLGDETWEIEQIASASGTAKEVTIPREAMGDGDPHLLAVIGAFLGAQSLLFVILASCVTAIIAAIAGRVGFGKALPYGPFLAIGAIWWIFGGHRLWESYLTLMR